MPMTFLQSYYINKLTCGRGPRSNIFVCMPKSNIVKLLALALTWLTWSPIQPNLALIDLVTNLTKPSLDLGKIWARGRHYNQTGHHPTTTTSKLFKGGNLRLLHSDCSEFQRENQFNTVIKQAGAKKQHFLKWIKMT